MYIHQLATCCTRRRVCECLQEQKAHVYSLAGNTLHEKACVCECLQEQKTHVYSLAGNTLHEKTCLEHNGAVTSVQYSPDGSMLAAGDTYRKVQLYQLPDYTV